MGDLSPALLTSPDGLDVVGARRPLPMDLGPASERAVVDNVAVTDVGWLGPYPDSRLAGTPDSRYEQREAVELAFVAALQHLPGNQRAALLLFDVLGFSAAEIAELMATSTASVNSSLQRARRLVAERVPGPSQQRTLRRLGDARLREVVTGFAAALENGDTSAIVDLLTEDVTWSMPPLPHWYHGIDAVADFVARVPTSRCGSWRTLPTRANGQPAVALYRRPGDVGAHHAWAITVLTLRGGRISQLTSFIGREHFDIFGLPAAWNDRLPAGWNDRQPR